MSNSEASSAYDSDRSDDQSRPSSCGSMASQIQENDTERPKSAGSVTTDADVGATDSVKDQLTDLSKTSLLNNDGRQENASTKAETRPMSRLSSRSSKWEEVSELDPSVESRWKTLLAKHNIGSASSLRRNKSLSDNRDDTYAEIGNEENHENEIEEEQDKTGSKVSFRSLVQKHGIGSRSISSTSLRNKRSGGHSRQGSVASVIQIDSHSLDVIPTFLEDACPSTVEEFDPKCADVNDTADAEFSKKEDDEAIGMKSEKTNSAEVESKSKAKHSDDDRIEEENENINTSSASNTDFVELNGETADQIEYKEGIIEMKVSFGTCRKY